MNGSVQGRFSAAAGRALLRLSLVAGLLGAGASAAAAQATVPELRSILYGGIGKAREQEADATPWTIGYLYAPRATGWTVGMDFAGEGTAFNNTTGHSDDPEQAWSLNVLVGVHRRMGSWDVGAAPLVGMRETGKHCASGDSYLGYDCYADEAPKLSFTANVGAVAHVAYGRVSLGARGTNASTEVLLGYRF
jgi:hypothetical protein